jgi:hypothetical protein
MSTPVEIWGVGGISDTKTQTFTVNKDGLISDRQNAFASDRRDVFALPSTNG